MGNTIHVVGTGLTQITSGNTVYYIDKESGEVVLEEYLKRLPKHKVEKYVGIDCRWLKDCVTESQFKETIGVIDGWSSQPVKVYHQVFNGFLLDGSITVQQARILTEISKHVVGWNIALTSTREISEATGISVQNVSKYIRNMSPNFVKIASRDTPSRGDLILEVSPLILWRGGSIFRIDKLKTWFSVFKYI